MTENVLQFELERVALRHRRMLLSAGLAIGWSVLALIGLVALLWARSGNRAVPGIVLVLLVVLAILLVPVLRAIIRITEHPTRIARWIERRYPDLDSRLLAAVEQQPDEKSHQLGFLQESVVREALHHAEFHPWESAISGAKLRLAQLAKWM